MFRLATAYRILHPKQHVVALHVQVEPTVRRAFLVLLRRRATRAIPLNIASEIERLLCASRNRESVAMCNELQGEIRWRECSWGLRQQLPRRLLDWRSFQ